MATAWVLRVQTPWTASSSTSLCFLHSPSFVRYSLPVFAFSDFGLVLYFCLALVCVPVYDDRSQFSFAVNKQRTYYKHNAASETMQDYALCLHGSWSAHRGQFAVGILAKSTHEKQTAKLPPVAGYARMLAYDTFFGMSSLAFCLPLLHDEFCHWERQHRATTSHEPGRRGAACLTWDQGTYFLWDPRVAPTFPPPSTQPHCAKCCTLHYPLTLALVRKPLLQWSYASPRGYWRVAGGLRSDRRWVTVQGRACRGACHLRVWLLHVLASSCRSLVQR